MQELRPARPQRSALPDQAPLAKSASTPETASITAHPAQSLRNGQGPPPKEHPLGKEHLLQKEHALQKEASAAIHIVAKASVSIAPRTPEQQSRWLVFQARVSEQAAEEKALQQQGSQVSACPPPRLTPWWCHQYLLCKLFVHPAMLLAAGVIILPSPALRVNSLHA